MTTEFTFHPVTPERWGDFEALFGERGAYAGCWCMWWRMTNADWNRATKDERKLGMKAIVNSGTVPGILAYDGDQAVGWCSVGPREDFVRIERSRKLVRMDGEVTWSVNCFYVARPYRKQGLMAALLKAAVDYARSQGAQVVEGYPSERTEEIAPVNVYTGVVSVFQEAGFEQVEKEIGGKVVKRYVYRGD